MLLQQLQVIELESSAPPQLFAPQSDHLRGEIRFYNFHCCCFPILITTFTPLSASPPPPPPPRPPLPTTTTSAERFHDRSTGLNLCAGIYPEAHVTNLTNRSLQSKANTLTNQIILPVVQRHLLLNTFRPNNPAFFKYKNQHDFTRATYMYYSEA